MVLGGIVLLFVGGAAAVASCFDTSGRWWIPVLGFASAIGAAVGVLLIVRGFGIGYVGPP